MRFIFSAVPAASAPWQVRACVEDACETATASIDLAASFAVRDDALGDDAPVSTQLRVIDAAGTTLIDNTLTVTPQL